MHFFTRCCYLLLLLMGLGRAAAAHNPGAGSSLADALNPDGTLRAGRTGSFDARGYTLGPVTATGQPTFRPASAQRVRGTGDDKWQNGFGIPGPNGLVYAVARTTNGDVYIGGTFTVVGTMTVSNLAKWNGAAWSALGTGANGPVNALALAANGDLYAGGAFTQVGGVAANNVAKWNGAAWSPLGTGTNGTVYALTMSPGGVLYVGGYFSQAGSVAGGIATWNGSAWSALGTNAGGVRTIALAANGDVYVGGSFSQAGAVAAKNVARWNGSVWSALGTGTDLPVLGLAVSSTGLLYAVGRFSYAGGVLTPFLACWNGSAWSSVGYPNNPAYSVAADKVGNVYIGGVFGSVGNVSNTSAAVTNGVARWNGTTWSALGTSAESNIAQMYALAVDANNVLTVGGDFVSVDNTGATNVATWNGTWDALGEGFNAAVNAVVVAPNGDMYIGGAFAQVGGVTAVHVAKWNGTTWSALGTDLINVVNALVLGSDGTLYAGTKFLGGSRYGTVVKWNGTTWASVALVGNPTDDVYALALDASGTLYAGGVFTRIGGSSSPVNYLAQYGRGGGWRAVGGSMNSGVFALAYNPANNLLYAGGYFTQAGGTAANKVASWDGTTWRALGDGLSGTNARVDALALAPNGDVYVGGGFMQAGTVAANNVAKWNGTAWSALGTGPNGYVKALALAGSTVYVGGIFTQAGTVAANNVAKWDGTAWSALGTGLNNDVKALADAGSNRVYVGGNFVTVGDASKMSAYFGIYGAAPLPVQLTQFTATVTGPTAAHLAWATASEKNSAYFAPESSTDGRIFQELGRVNAQGSSTQPHAYAFTDPGSARTGSGTVYYRLRQVDADGTFRYSPVRTVTFAGAAAGLLLHPNPARGAATLAGTAPGTMVTVTDALGRPVTTAMADAAGTATLALPAGLPAGVYVVRAGTKAVRLTVD